MFSTCSVFPSHSIQSVSRLRFTLSLFLNLLWTTAAYSQRSFTSFGPTIDYAIGYTPLSLATGQFNIGGVAQIVTVSKEEPNLHFYRLTPSGVIPVHSMSVSNPPSFVGAVDLDGDGTTECLMLSSDGMAISIIANKGEGVSERTIPLNTPAQRLIVADINNDKRKDILLFGKRREGMSSLLGNTFIEGPMLFPEISISDAKATDLNGDGITDILLLSWLTNQLDVFYGIGRGIFSEQTAIDLPSEPLELAITPVTKQRTIQIAVTFPEKNQIGIYKGDATGDFDPVEMINCLGSPGGIKFAHLNDDPFIDLVTSAEEGILVSLGMAATRWGALTTFSAGRTIASWALADLDSDGKIDLVLADRSTKRIVLVGNASYSGTIAWPNRYSVGAEPGGLAVQDFNNDGIPDVAVVSNASSSLSVLFGRGKGLLTGQQSVSLSDHPEFIKTLSPGVESQRVLVVSHPSADRVTAIRLADEVDRSTSFSIPTGSNPFVLFAREDSSTHQMEMLVRHTSPKGKSLSVSLFEQISSGQFLERSLRPSLAFTILALTVDAFRQGGPNDLLFITNDQSSKQSTLSIGLGGEGFDFKEITPLLSYPDSLAATRSIVSAYVNGDAFKDIVIYLTGPRNSLGIIHGRSDGTVRDSVVWVRGVHLAGDDAIFFRDVDGDTETDIAYLDPSAKAVMVAYGKKDGTFHPPKLVYPAQGVTSFRIEPMRNTHNMDLILSNAANGTVSVIFDPFSR